MPVLKLTKAAIDKIPLTKEGQKLYFDNELKGFGLVVGKQSKTYIVQNYIDNKRVRCTIGRHGVFTPEQARKEAIIHLADMPIIRSKIRPDSIVYTDCFSPYDALDISEFHHVRINHSELFADGKNHINGIENFWNQAKRVLRKYNGIPRENFLLFLKECEFRFNYGTPRQQLDTLRKWCKI